MSFSSLDKRGKTVTWVYNTLYNAIQYSFLFAVCIDKVYPEQQTVVKELI